ncbi:hypothetical protein BDV29DRAFT_163837 [Aspergillus leporis]|uniref:Uncharacterized protein n=1 Tax=Aspergillus leporis TaxID=41062 RepID=A0A5N5WI38_9EURO|nr:hypothetical protein BDV29DRAFT_163837 [Aspergillus leporis]
MDTVSKGSIKAQLVSTSCCKAHWIISFSQFGECINAELSGNTLWYTREIFAEVLDSIEFRINDGVPPIDEMKGHMWLPEHLMKQQEFCRSAEWVWGVLWLYTHIGYIENFSTAGISLGQLLELLVDKQLEALIYVGMGRLHIENELSHSLCSGCISFNMQFISISR